MSNPFGPPKEEAKMEDVQLDAPVVESGEHGDDPPLLEDLDIDIVKIKYKFIAILT